MRYKNILGSNSPALGEFCNKKYYIKYQHESLHIPDVLCMHTYAYLLVQFLQYPYYFYYLFFYFYFLLNEIITLYTYIPAYRSNTGLKKIGIHVWLWTVTAKISFPDVLCAFKNNYFVMLL